MKERRGNKERGKKMNDEGEEEKPKGNRRKCGRRKEEEKLDIWGKKKDFFFPQI